VPVKHLEEAGKQAHNARTVKAILTRRQLCLAMPNKEAMPGGAELAHFK
jgi:hypothetical protein